jgi:hypothetical protein
MAFLGHGCSSAAATVSANFSRQSSGQRDFFFLKEELNQAMSEVFHG